MDFLESPWSEDVPGGCSASMHVLERGRKNLCKFKFA